MEEEEQHHIMMAVQRAAAEAARLERERVALELELASRPSAKATRELAARVAELEEEVRGPRAREAHIWNPRDQPDPEANDRALAQPSPSALAPAHLRLCPSRALSRVWTFL